MYFGRGMPHRTIRRVLQTPARLCHWMVLGCVDCNQLQPIDILIGAPPRARNESRNRYLWVIDDTGIPYILEAQLPELNGELPKYTNRIGDEHAKQDELHLGEAPIPSMREFVEDNLGIPVVQAEFSQRIAGATIAVSDVSPIPCRGIILNTVGANRNPLVRRATLVHEVGHLLFDPDQQLDSVRVDSYDGVSADPERDALVSTEIDFVEQRANAFAISLLAPIRAEMIQSMYPIGQPQSVN